MFNLIEFFAKHFPYPHECLSPLKNFPRACTNKGCKMLINITFDPPKELWFKAMLNIRSVLFHPLFLPFRHFLTFACKYNFLFPVHLRTHFILGNIISSKMPVVNLWKPRSSIQLHCAHASLLPNSVATRREMWQQAAMDGANNIFF
jgi:hypothetical protein